MGTRSRHRRSDPGGRVSSRLGPMDRWQCGCRRAYRWANPGCAGADPTGPPRGVRSVHGGRPDSYPCQGGPAAGSRGARRASGRGGRLPHRGCFRGKTLLGDRGAYGWLAGKPARALKRQLARGGWGISGHRRQVRNWKDDPRGDHHGAHPTVDRDSDDDRAGALLGPECPCVRNVNQRKCTHRLQRGHRGRGSHSAVSRWPSNSAATSGHRGRQLPVRR